MVLMENQSHVSALVVKKITYVRNPEKTCDSSFILFKSLNHFLDNLSYLF